MDAEVSSVTYLDKRMPLEYALQIVVSSVDIKVKSNRHWQRRFSALVRRVGKVKVCMSNGYGMGPI